MQAPVKETGAARRAVTPQAGTCLALPSAAEYCDSRCGLVLMQIPVAHR